MESDMDTPKRVIRVFPDFCNRWPLWESSAENNTPTPTDLGLSPELTQAIKEWYDFWELHCDLDAGWDSRESAAHCVATGDRWVAQLRDEVAAFADVSDERARSVQP